jgi:hypothetical protein
MQGGDDQERKPGFKVVAVDLMPQCFPAGEGHASRIGPD